MAILNNAKYKKNSNISTRVIDGKVIIVHLGGEVADVDSKSIKDFLYVLDNKTAILIWDLLDKHKDVSSIKEVLIKKYRSDEKTIDSDLMRYMKELLSANLIEKY